MPDPAPPNWPADRAGAFLLRFARLLLAAGADSEHVRRRTEALASHLGIAIRLFIDSERLLLMVEAGGDFRTRIGRAVGGFGIDAGRLAALESLAGDLDRAIPAPDTAEAALTRIERAAPRYPALLAIVAVAGTAAALARLFGAAWPVVAGAFVGGMVNTALRRWLAAHGIPYLPAAAINAALSGLVAALVLKLAPGASPAFALTAAGMILVPGVPLINGIVDLVNGHAAMGIARSATGVAVLIAIGAGLFAASALSGSAFPVALAPGKVAPAEDLFFSGLAAFGFAILFNAPRRAIAPIVLCGAVAHAARSLIERWCIEPATATCLCAMLAAVMALYAGRRLAMPWTIFAFPGVVAMVPGSYAFRAAIGALHLMDEGAAASPVLVAETLSTGFTALVSTAAIAVGLAIVAAVHELPAARAPSATSAP